MANLTKLKTHADKGTPPIIGPKGDKGIPPSETNDNLTKPSRETPAKKTKIEFSVPESVANAFSQEAGQRFGFKKGSKSDLFIAMFQEYVDRKVG